MGWGAYSDSVGGVLDWESKDLHRNHYALPLSKTLCPLSSTALVQVDLLLSRHD